MGKHKNPWGPMRTNRSDMMGRIEKREQVRYAAKYAMSEARFDRDLRSAMQMCCDAALIAWDDAREKPDATAAEFFAMYSRTVNDICTLLREDSEDDPKLWYSTAKVDERLKQILGDSFTPWEERYI